MRSAILTLVLATAAVAQSLNVDIPYQKFTLNNGLTLIVHEDHKAPIVAVNIWYHVGSKNEKPGKTGFAHLFEHLMFGGSEHVKMRYINALEQVGATDLNGTTNNDRTNYFETVPTSALDYTLFLESDRMRSLAVNQANLDNQRNAVQEERRLGVDNQPYGETSEVLQALVYDNFANKHSVIGSMEDLNAATIKDVQEFFRIYYAPNDAVLTLVGDFQPAEALAKIKKYFGDIPAQPAPPVPVLAEPPQTAERQKTIEDPFARTPRLDIAFKTPPGNTSDVYALDVLSSALGEGQASRLYQTLVKDKELAVNVFCYVEEHRGPSTFNIVVLARPGKDLKEVEKAVYAEVERVKSEPIADWELEKIRMTNRRQTAQQLQSTLFRAYQIGEMASIFGDPNLINTRLDKEQSVGKQDIQRVAKTYLTEENRTVVTTLPKPKTEAAANASH